MEAIFDTLERMGVNKVEVSFHPTEGDVVDRSTRTV
jgi:hypothetical protein